MEQKAARINKRHLHFLSENMKSIDSVSLVKKEISSIVF